jgi:hypothetical protein
MAHRIIHNTCQIALNWLESEWLLLAGVRFFSVLLAGFILLSSLIYGASVYYERILVMEGRDARQMEEENMALRVQLDKLQAYQQVSKISLEKVHLKPASDPITIMAKAPISLPELRTPSPKVPKAAHGY